MSKKKKKKLRVAFRKNRGKRVRQNDLTHEVLDERPDLEDEATRERLSGKGELSRYRTVVGVEQSEEGEIRREVDEAGCLQGRVLSAIGLNCVVLGEDGKRYTCTVRRVVRTLAREARNAVVTGDDVLFQPTGHEDEGVIERVEPRRGTISRFSHRREHVIVANVDQVAIVVSAADPPLKPNLIDRFLISAEKGGVGAIICINKADLIDPVEIQPVLGRYAQLGYDVVLTSAADDTGIPRLRALLKDRETVFTGQSGVGKSSILNRIQEDLSLETGDVSDWTRKGRHTTRRAVLLELEFGGYVVDTPGIRQLDLWGVQPEEVEGYFIEFRPFVPRCRFPDCTHTHEQDCGVKRAVADDLISLERYESYARIVMGD